MVKIKKVILEVNQGLISLKSGEKYLEGIQIEIRDRDTDGIDEEHIKKDKRGDYFLQDI